MRHLLDGRLSYFLSPAGPVPKEQGARDKKTRIVEGWVFDMKEGLHAETGLAGHVCDFLWAGHKDQRSPEAMPILACDHRQARNVDAAMGPAPIRAGLPESGLSSVDHVRAAEPSYRPAYAECFLSPRIYD